MTDHLEWPFFEDRHRTLASKLEQWCKANVSDAHGADIDSECRTLVRSLGEAGFLRLCVADAVSYTHLTLPTICSV